MTYEQALLSLRGRLGQTGEAGGELAPEVLRKAEEALTYYVLVQGQKLPGYAEVCARQSRVGRKLRWIETHMAEAEIDEMLTVYHDEPVESLLAGGTEEGV